MRKTVIAATVALALTAPTFVFAADAAPASPHTFTGNVGFASEYLYRGIAQTRGKPALQGGFDYSHASGLYAGVWGSNISWLSDVGQSVSLEIDAYGGYKGAFAGDFGYDVGVLTYNYPGSNKPTGAAKPDTTEVYGALSYKWVTLKYSHSLGSLFGATKISDGSKTKGSGYLELNASYDLGSGWGVNGHVGRQKVKGNDTATYSDYKIGVTKDVGFGVVGLAYSATNAKDSCAAGAVGQFYCATLTSNAANTYETGKDVAVLTFNKSF